MANTTKKQQLTNGSYFAVLALITVIVLLVTYLLAKNFYSTITLNANVLSKKTAAADILDSDYHNAKLLTNSYSSVSSQKTLVNDSLPSDTDIPGTASILQAIASNTSTVFSGVALSTQSTPGTASSVMATTKAGAGLAIAVPITISAQASYANLDQFLTGIESSSRPLQINSLGLSGTNQALKINITATTFYTAPITFKVPMETVSK